MKPVPPPKPSLLSSLSPFTTITSPNPSKPPQASFIFYPPSLFHSRPLLLSYQRVQKTYLLTRDQILPLRWCLLSATYYFFFILFPSFCFHYRFHSYAHPPPLISPSSPLLSAFTKAPLTAYLHVNHSINSFSILLLLFITFYCAGCRGHPSTLPVPGRAST